MVEQIRYWTPKVKNGKSSCAAYVDESPLVQAFVQAAQAAGFRYPAEFVRASGLKHPGLQRFISGGVVLTPERMLTALSFFPEEFRSPILDLCAEEIAKGRGSYKSVRGSERAHRAAVNASLTKKSKQLQSI